MSWAQADMNPFIEIHIFSSNRVIIYYNLAVARIWL